MVQRKTLQRSSRTRSESASGRILERTARIEKKNYQNFKAMEERRRRRSTSVIVALIVIVGVIVMWVFTAKEAHDILGRNDGGENEEVVYSGAGDD